MRKRSKNFIECPAILNIADDYGDNSATILCQRPLNHKGKHREIFYRTYGNIRVPIKIEWIQDETNCNICDGDTQLYEGKKHDVIWNLYVTNTSETAQEEYEKCVDAMKDCYACQGTGLLRSIIDMKYVFDKENKD